MYVVCIYWHSFMVFLERIYNVRAIASIDVAANRICGRHAINEEMESASKFVCFM